MKQLFLRLPASAALFLTMIAGPGIASAQQQSFSDVPPDHPVFAAAEYLKSEKIISGYSDGTFQPDKKVNRAEALKIIIGGLITQEQLDLVQGTDFSDIAPDAWYLPYVEIAKVNGIVDGPPKKTEFYGERPVMKVEFIKMLLLAQKVDAGSSYSEIRLPLSSDVSNVDEWFYPYLRYALTSSMTMIGQDGLLHPANELTRGETALLLHRYLMYVRGRRTQALLSEAESEILVILSMLENNNIAQAEYASARALLAARGAHASKPNEPIVIGALKISEAFRALVRAYRSGVNGDFGQVEKLAKDAWSLAEKAKGAEMSLSTLADQVQTISQNMAESARAEKEKTQ
ncbi:MAG TPA: S-layer homology domain-containing protein [Candidatus Peribacteraceae bacterium]|nr:S-layer homology domain-containing protein [Candidatus Peribacteraceae bacterium]